MTDGPELRIGDFRIRWLQNGRFRLDGGASFGVVPKIMWEQKYPCDEDNFVPLTTDPLLVDGPGYRFLIDAGMGDTLTPKQRQIHQVEYSESLDQSLQRLNVDPSTVDDVILTHYHFDHVGGLTQRKDGQILPALPGSRVVVQKDEWREVQNPTARSSVSYWKENWEVLEATEQIHLVDGRVQLADGVELVPTGGHSSGHQLILLRSKGETLVHLGDLLATHAHINPRWIMAIDDYPMQSLSVKRDWLRRAKQAGWWLSFYHDPFMAAGRWNEQDELVDQVRRSPEPVSG